MMMHMQAMMVAMMKTTMMMLLMTALMYEAIKAEILADRSSQSALLNYNP